MKLVKYVDSEISKLMTEQARRLGLKPNGKYLKYLVLQFGILYSEKGQDATRAIVLGMIEGNSKSVVVSKPKMLQGLEANTKRLFIGYADFMDCGGQGEFLKYLILQQKEYEVDTPLDKLKKVVYSYV